MQGQQAVWVIRKLDGSVHRSAPVTVLDRDADGLWLGLNTGALVTRPGKGDYLHPCDAVCLLPTDQMWTAVWLVEHDPELHVDVSTGLAIFGDEISTVDLDLDVVRFAVSRTTLLDRDEFNQHRAQLGYPPDLVAAAERTAQQLIGQVARREEPFGHTAKDVQALHSVDRDQGHTSRRRFA